MKYNNNNIKFGEDIVLYTRKNREKSIVYLTHYMLLTDTSRNHITQIFLKPLSNHIEHLSNVYRTTMEHQSNHFEYQFEHYQTTFNYY